MRYSRRSSNQSSGQTGLTVAVVVVVVVVLFSFIPANVTRDQATCKHGKVDCLCEGFNIHKKAN